MGELNQSIKKQPFRKFDAILKGCNQNVGFFVRLSSSIFILKIRRHQENEGAVRRDVTDALCLMEEVFNGTVHVYCCVGVGLLRQSIA